LRIDLERAGFVDKVGEDRIFMTLPTAVDGYVAWSVENLGEPPEGFPSPR
jgi:SulP family sulfate permease